jgi:hypothetical protein
VPDLIELQNEVVTYLRDITSNLDEYLQNQEYLRLWAGQRSQLSVRARLEHTRSHGTNPHFPLGRTAIPEVHTSRESKGPVQRWPATFSARSARFRRCQSADVQRLL